MRPTTVRTAPLLFFALAFFLVPQVAGAQTCSLANNTCPSGQACVNGTCQAISPPPSGTDTLYNPLGTTDLWTLAYKILDFLIRIGAVVVVFMVVYVGFRFITAQGNETALGEAKKILLWTIVGALILLGAKAITLGVCETVKALSTGTTITCLVF